MDFERVGGAGFEPAKAEPTDLQSVPFDRFGNPPKPSSAKHLHDQTKTIKIAEIPKRQTKSRASGGT